MTTFMIILSAAYLAAVLLFTLLSGRPEDARRAVVVVLNVVLALAAVGLCWYGYLLAATTAERIP